MRFANRLCPALALAVVLGLSAAATAQPGPAPVSPPFSPYLNLLRNGNSPAVNYYGLVRPQQSFNRAVQGLQTGVTDNARSIDDLAGGTGLLATGSVPTQFLNHGGYFLNQRGGGAGGGSFSAGGGRMTYPSGGSGGSRGGPAVR